MANRFNRPAQIAKFNPMTAQDIMAVPLMKQQIEDDQFEEQRSMLTDMYNMQSTQADQGRTNAVKEGIKGRMDEMAENIANNGVSAASSQQFKKLKSEYDKVTSLSGDLGQANAYAAKAQEAKKVFYAAGDKKGIDGGMLNTAWENIAKRRSVFNEDGSYNQEYEMGDIPQYGSIQNELEDRLKGVGFKDITKDGYKAKTNLYGLTALRDSTVAKYTDPNSSEYQWAIDTGLDPETLAQEVGAIADSFVAKSLQYTYSDSAAYATGVARAKAASKAKAEVDVIEGEYLGKNSGIMAAAEVGGTAVERARQISDLKLEMEKAQEEGDTQKYTEISQQFQRKKQMDTKMNEWYKKGQGKNLYAELEPYLDTKNKNSEAYKEIAAGRRTFELEGDDDYVYVLKGETHGAPKAVMATGAPISFGPADGNDVTETLEEKAKRSIKIPKKEYEEYNKALTNYNRGLDAVVADDKAHIASNSFSFNTQIANTPEEKRQEKLQEGLSSSLIDSPASWQVEMGSYMGEGGEKKYFKELDSSSVGAAELENNEAAMMNLVSRTIAQNPKAVRSVRQGQGTQAPGVVVRVEIPSKASDKNSIYPDGSHGQEVEFTIGNRMIKGDKATNLMTSGISEMGAAGRVMANKNRQYEDYNDFIPSYGINDDYVNNSKLHTRMRSTSSLGKVYNQDGKPYQLDIVKAPNGKFVLQTKDKAKNVDPARYSDIGQQYQLDTDGGLNKFIAENEALTYHILTPLKNSPEYRAMGDDTTAKRAYLSAGVRAKINSGDVIETDSAYDLLDMMK